MNLGLNIDEILLLRDRDYGNRIVKNTEKGHDKKRDYQIVAKEMESLFLYELIKIMRQTSETMGEKKGFGYNTYISMFDMEVSRLLAERGMGLQDSILRWLERIPDGDGRWEMEDKNSSMIVQYRSK